MNPAYDNSEVLTSGAITYNYVNSRAGVGSCVGHRNPAPRCHPECFGAQRRNVSKDRQWAPTNTRHGYTGHEHLDKYNLINMNGRVYDPITGRFLSPDPVLQDPSNAQNYNKFSYVLNNPLKFTDPSGYWLQPISHRINLFDMLDINRDLNLDREAHWQAMHSGGDETYAFLAVLCGGSGSGGGGNMFGPNPTASAPEGEDVTGEVVARETGLTYQLGYSLIEGVGAFSGFFISYSFIVQASNSKYLLSVSASAWAPYVETVMDNITYFGNVEIYDENGNFVSKETLGADFFDHGSDIGITGYSYIGISNENIKSGYSAKLSVSYFASSSFQGSYAGPVFTHWFSF
ncbi:MAG: hypothetical protein A2W93_05975 [Bacteroidetes bacterium GWF2_43_63]|nr:MAG: hypothetical protein A2W94_04470 [Bacteroidetes bacterium GWE2_42_42]OFY55966.1 MAG: hypothetical protein A2W93_05975 [Bacteroidetes bacterium GWF2_43_63]HBG71531.1 hypothetical protein [Bacteroidales bacterium]HCB63003.1 hypothetical protein [Bacteroidales bacterium]HCY22292.1 hypothetical protein [Bacteroidales bacterium]